MNIRSLKILAVSLGLCAAAGHLVAQVTLTNLYSFSNVGSISNGVYPVAGLAQGSDGNFYGTTSSGGGIQNGGTVFRINPSGSLTTLWMFDLRLIPANGDYDGSNPKAGLVQGSDGNFYGTTYSGGTGSLGVSPLGTVFRLDTTGSLTLTTLHTFTNNSDGAGPAAGLVQGRDGYLYGTTTQGGVAINYGTLFRISPSGSFSNLYSFTGGSDGKTPLAGLVQGSDGNFYGTTEFGGTNGHGNVFKLIVPLNPPANQISAIKVAGTNVLVTIPSVTAEIYQLQYRTSLTAGAWANVAGASATSIGGSLTMTNFGGFPQSQQFYRFAITP